MKLDRIGLVLAVAGAGLLTPGSRAPDRESLGTTNTVWRVPADFADIASAVASPLVGDGDTLLVQAGYYGSFDLTKSLVVLAAAGSRFDAHDCAVHGVSSFTIAGMSATTLEISGVSGRARLDDCSIGWLTWQSPIYWTGSTSIAACDELLVTRCEFHGTEACYPFGPGVAGTAVTVFGSRAVFVDCRIFGGDGWGSEGCAPHYATAGEGMHLVGSDVVLAGCSVSGGMGNFGATRSAIGVGAQTNLRVLGSSSNTLWSMLPSLPIDSDPSSIAVVSGVTLSPAQLPAWVVQPAEAEPWLRLLGPDTPGATKTVEIHGPRAALAWVDVGALAALVRARIPVPDPLWLDPRELADANAVTLHGQDAAVFLPLPPLPTRAGRAWIVQAILPSSPGGFAYLTNPADAITRW